MLDISEVEYAIKTVFLCLFSETAQPLPQLGIQYNQLWEKKHIDLFVVPIIYISFTSASNGAYAFIISKQLSTKKVWIAAWQFVLENTVLIIVWFLVSN